MSGPPLRVESRLGCGSVQPAPSLALWASVGIAREAASERIGATISTALDGNSPAEVVPLRSA